MAKSESIQSKKIKSLLFDLLETNIKKQVSAIKSLKVHGNESVIRPIVEVLVSTEDELLRSEIIDLLNTIKSTKVPSQIAKCLTDESLKSVHKILLASVWNSGLNYTSYLKEIVQATVHGDMMSAIECITIIENIEDEFSEEDIFEPLLILKEYLNSNKDIDGTKKELLLEITTTLQKINDNL